MYEQSDILLPVCEIFGNAIIRDGFGPHLQMIVPEIKEIWSQHQALPFTILSHTLTDVDYWEPTWDRSSRTLVPICGSLRNLLRLGFTEFLYITETWVYQEPLPAGEMLAILWWTQVEGKSHTCHIKKGKRRKYLHVIGQEWEPIQGAVNPMLNPWHTTKDIFDYLGVPENERRYERLEEQFRIGIEAFEAMYLQEYREPPPKADTIRKSRG